MMMVSVSLDIPQLASNISLVFEKFEFNHPKVPQALGIQSYVGDVHSSELNLSGIN